MAVETKSDLNKDTIERLQELIQVNIDSAEGYRHAADKVESNAYAVAFREIAEEREAQAEALRSFVAYNREEPQREGSYAAMIHRCWMSCREAVSSNNVHAVLAEAERGEDAIKEAYEDAIKETAGSAMNDVLMRQYNRVKSDHDTIRDLRDATK